MKQIVSVSLSSDEAKSLNELALQKKTNRTAIVREALRQYKLQEQWAQIREWGRETALKLGISSYDDVERIFGRHAK